MSLETELKRLADAAERIADGLGVLAQLEGGFKSIDTSPAEPEEGKDSAASTSEDSTEESSSSSQTEPESTSGEHTKEDVRDALKALGKRVDSAAAREILKTVGKAKSLTDLAEERYGAVIEAANAAE